VIAEVTPDPEILSPLAPCIRQLELVQGNPWPTWTVTEGPAGLQVSACGLVSGWTPGPADIGDHPIAIRAANSEGSDAEEWVVRVVSNKDFDFDGDVDPEDFGLLQRCLSGDCIGISEVCPFADLDSDGDVDETDFSLFWSCMAGAGELPGC